MKKLIILFTSLVALTVNAQDYGYFGKKNTITLRGALAPRFASNLIVFDRYSSDIYNLKSYPITYGGTLGYERQIERNKFIGLELGVNNTASRIDTPYSSYYYNLNNNDAYTGQIEQHARIRYNVFAPTFTFSRAYSGNIAPIGIQNTMGFGLLIAKPIAKEYDYTLKYDNGYTETVPKAVDSYFREHVYSQDFFKTTWGIRFYWQTALNVPITKNLLWTIAVRGNINIYLPIIFSVENYEENVMLSGYRQRSRFATSELMNILEINTGLKFAF